MEVRLSDSLAPLLEERKEENFVEKAQRIIRNQLHPMFYNTKLKDAPSYVLPELAQLCGPSKKETVPEEDSPF